MITFDDGAGTVYSIRAQSTAELVALLKALHQRENRLNANLKNLNTGFRRNELIIELSHIVGLNKKTNRLLDAMEAAADTNSTGEK